MNQFHKSFFCFLILKNDEMYDTVFYQKFLNTEFGFVFLFLFGLGFM